VIGHLPLAQTGRGQREPKHATPEKMSKEQRTAILNVEIARWAALGWVLEDVSFGTQAMMRKSKLRVLGWDVLLAVLTLGLWLVYVICRSAIGRETSLIILVDRHGSVKAFERKSDARLYTE
jgi:hypothetical protein